MVSRIQELQPVEKRIWEPISVPMARFVAFEQMARSAKGRRRFRVKLGRKGLRAPGREPRKPSARASRVASDTLALD